MKSMFRYAVYSLFVVLWSVAMAYAAPCPNSMRLVDDQGHSCGQ
jgi:hypothetical protein